MVRLGSTTKIRVGEVCSSRVLRRPMLQERSLWKSYVLAPEAASRCSIELSSRAIAPDMRTLRSPAGSLSCLWPGHLGIDRNLEINTFHNRLRIAKCLGGFERRRFYGGNDRSRLPV